MIAEQRVVKKMRICASTDRSAASLKPGGLMSMFFALMGCWVGEISAAAAASASAQLIPSTEKGWPQFRGLHRDGKSAERGLLSQWPEGGPRLLWSATNLGRGFSAPAISGERLVLAGDVDEFLVLMAFDLQGQPLWRATNGASWKTPYPGARASVTFSGGQIYHQNAHGRVACFDEATGREEWAVDVLEKFKGSNITWGMSENLLVDGASVYVTAGGEDALMVALNKTDGSVRWKSPALYDSAGEKRVENASYVSPILVQFGKRRLVIGASLRHVFCVDADTGALQWSQPFRTTYSVLAMMPVLVGNGVFLTAPHGPDGRYWELLEAEGKVGVKEGWTTSLDTCQGGVVIPVGRAGRRWTRRPVGPSFRHRTS
jgi:outer membrane protein assembly factor BamB